MTLHEMMYLENKKYSEGKTGKKKVVKEFVKVSNAVIDRIKRLFEEADSLPEKAKRKIDYSGYYTYGVTIDNPFTVELIFTGYGATYARNSKTNYLLVDVRIPYKYWSPDQNGSFRSTGRYYIYLDSNTVEREDSSRNTVIDDEFESVLPEGLEKYADSFEKVINIAKNSLVKGNDTTVSKSRETSKKSVKHPSRQEVDKAKYFGNPYDGQFSSEEDRQQAIKSYESRIQAAETRLDRNANLNRSQGGYDRWHEDKDSIGYMYDRLALMKSAKLK